MEANAKRSRAEMEAGAVQLSLIVPGSSVSGLIGPKGANIRLMEQSSGAHIQYAPADEVHQAFLCES